MRRVVITRDNQFLGVFEHKNEAVIQDYVSQITGIPVANIILQPFKVKQIKNVPHVNQMTIDDFLRGQAW